MSTELESIDAELTEWIGQQKMFFVATAPLAADGHVNLSPKGGEAFRVLGPHEVAYQDYTGSGAETAAHVRENGRIVIMLCAFEGPPKIVRLHGRGEVITPKHKAYAVLAGHFPPHVGTRAFVRIAVERVSRSCGYSVPLYDFREPRDTLDRYCEQKGPEGLAAYRAEKNQVSIDGLPAFSPAE